MGKAARGAAAAFTALAALALVLSGCAAADSGAPDSGAPDPGLRGQWELLSAKDTAGKVPIADQLITLTVDASATSTGRSSCTDYRARIYGTIERLWVTATLPKAEHCPTQIQQDIEQRYISDLNQVRTSTVSGTQLDLRAPGIDLQYQQAHSVSLAPLIGHDWELVTVSADSYYASANSFATPIDTTGASLFFSNDGRLIGTTECRQFTADYTQDAGEIVLRRYIDLTTGPCNADAKVSDTDVVSVLKSGFTVLSGTGSLFISSPRVEIDLGFVDSRDSGPARH